MYISHLRFLTLSFYTASANSGTNSKIVTKYSLPAMADYETEQLTLKQPKLQY